MFKTNKELRLFVLKIYEELKLNDENELSNELNIWNENVYTTSSEFLGELMLILEKVLQTSLILSTKSQIEECIMIIKKQLK